MSLSPGIHSLAVEEIGRRAPSPDRAARAPHPAADLIGEDPAIRAVVELAKQVADTAASVLITGESGSGKEVIAQIIRRHSGPRSEPFVAVNCGAIPESLQESEFFGHVKGAFTGAIERKTGKLERANGGTIFLDEIGAMSKSLQAALLRTLQSGEYSPVGSSETRFCNVRVIAAANRDLIAMIDAGEFRSDLYYRLNIIRLEIPPLRERKGDIPRLCKHFAATLGAKYGKPGLRVSDEAIRALLGYDFPGNVRELENFLGRAVILCRGEVIDLEHLPAEVIGTSSRRKIADDLDDFQSAKARVVEEFERAYITSVLHKCGGIISRASSYSGLSERNFHEKLKRYNINAKSFRGPARD